MARYLNHYDYGSKRWQTLTAAPGHDQAIMIKKNNDMIEAT